MSNMGKKRKLGAVTGDDPALANTKKVKVDPSKPFSSPDYQRAAHDALLDGLRDALQEVVQSSPAAGQASQSAPDETKGVRQLGQSLLSALEVRRQPGVPMPASCGGLPPLPIIHDAALRDRVFTCHGALLAPNNQRADLSYERLEFLGDAYLEAICSRLLYDHFPDLMPGRLSQLRQGLVNNDHLARLARAYGFEKDVKAPPDASKKWGAVNGVNKRLADVFEAYVAAVILDAPVTGLATATAWLTALFLPHINKVASTSASAPASASASVAHVPNANAKQELATKLLTPISKLQYLDQAPPQVQRKQRGAMLFTVGVFLTGWGYNHLRLGSGQGRSKSEAGQMAAVRALENRSLMDEVMTRRREVEMAISSARKKEEVMEEGKPMDIDPRQPLHPHFGEVNANDVTRMQCSDDEGPSKTDGGPPSSRHAPILTHPLPPRPPTSTIFRFGAVP